ncbi:MAG: SH3 domain-containing protein [Chloroflexota bacterium]
MYKLALRWVKEGKREEALQLLTTAAIYASADVDVWVVLGKLHAQAKRFDEAVRAWERALAVQADEQRALAGIREVRRIQQRRRLSLWGMPLIGALVIFLCGVAGGRQSFSIFPASSGSPSQPAEISSYTETSPPQETATIVPTPTVGFTEEPMLTLTVVTNPTVCHIATGFANGKLYVREGPGTDYLIIGWVTEGEQLTVLETIEGSTWIRVVTSSSIEGFVNGRFCK